MGTNHSKPVVALIPPSCCGAGYFRRLSRALSGEFEIRAVELPGHGRRYAEPYLTNAPAAVADVLDQLDGPVDAVYGESLGAYIGLAAAAALSRSRKPLLIAASNSPPTAQPALTEQHIDTMESAVATLTSMGGVIPDEVVNDPQLAAGAFPLIRADLLLSQSFIETVCSMTIPGDLLVLGGDRDNSLTALPDWAQHTTGRCEQQLMPGGHLLAQSNPSGVAAALRTALTEV